MLLKSTTVIPLLSLLSLSLAAPFEHHRHFRHAKRDAEPDSTHVVTVVSIVQLANVEATATQNAANTFTPTTLSLVPNNIGESTAATSSVNDDVQYKLVTGISSSSSINNQPTTLSTSIIESSESSSSSLISTETSASSSSYAESSSSSSSSDSTSNTASAGSVEYYANMGKGITYSPYTDSGSCKSSSEIASDMSVLSSFDVIRIYAPDCSVVSAMLNSISSNQKIFAGLYYLDSLSSDVDTLAEQVTSSSRGWDAIYAVSVGNEWVNSGTYDASTVVSAVSSGRSLLSNKGYSGSVVTVDTVPAYQSNPSLCDASDFAAVNQHAFWNGAIAPENSGSFLQDTISSMNSLCGKDVLICETGWPTQGSTYGSLGVPGKSEQLASIKSIAESVPDNVIFFTTYNDYWKSPGDYGVEQYWGIFD